MSILIEIKVVTPDLGEFVWVPPIELQEKIIRLPLNTQTAFKQMLADLLRQYLLMVSGISIILGSTTSGIANYNDLCSTLRSLAERNLQRCMTELGEG